MSSDIDVGECIAIFYFINALSNQYLYIQVQ